MLVVWEAEGESKAQQKRLDRSVVANMSELNRPKKRMGFRDGVARRCTEFRYCRFHFREEPIDRANPRPGQLVSVLRMTDQNGHLLNRSRRVEPRVDIREDILCPGREELPIR